MSGAIVRSGGMSYILGLTGGNSSLSCLETQQYKEGDINLCQRVCRGMLELCRITHGPQIQYIVAQHIPTWLKLGYSILIPAHLKEGAKHQTHFPSSLTPSIPPSLLPSLPTSLSSLLPFSSCRHSPPLFFFLPVMKPRALYVRSKGSSTELHFCLPLGLL